MARWSASQKTRLALLLSGLLSEPLVGLVGLLPFFLRKDLHASVFQISLFTMVKPVVALLSFYWGASLWKNRHKLLSNWMGAWLGAHLPFLLFPLMGHTGFLIVGVALFQFFQRGGMPAQMELLKQHVPPGAREGFFSWSSALNFFSGAIVGLLFSSCMHATNWKYLFFWSAAVGLVSLFFQARIPVEKEIVTEDKKTNRLLEPWKESLKLLRQRDDFARFQIGFMWGGVGLMLIMPALVLYSVDDLGLSHADMTLSRFVWMGLGFVLATPFWRKKIAYENLFGLTSLACLLFAVSALLWILGAFHLQWFFLAFFCYGIAQAGSHIIWHLSGPLFAKDEESSRFSTVNVLTVGLRGLIVPFVASLLCEWVGALFVLALGLCACLGGACYLFAQKKLPQHAPS
jgi:MFS family permease